MPETGRPTARYRDHDEGHAGRAGAVRQDRPRTRGRTLTSGDRRGCHAVAHRLAEQCRVGCRLTSSSTCRFSRPRGRAHDGCRVVVTFVRSSARVGAVDNASSQRGHGREQGTAMAIRWRRAAMLVSGVADSISGPDARLTAWGSPPLAGAHKRHRSAASPSSVGAGVTRK